MHNNRLIKFFNNFNKKTKNSKKKDYRKTKKRKL